MSDKRLQLYYWDGGNFGDDLNIWLWDKLLPEVVDTKTPYDGSGKRPLFVGIGTILTNLLPVDQFKVIFGGGVGYHKLPDLSVNSKIYCVRGPLTASKLNLDKSLAITDPAVLIRKIDLPKHSKKYKYSFMPHHSSLVSVNWKKVCTLLGINYIDPTESFEKSLKAIMESEVIIAEAMHAAIVADALRIPWVAVNLHGENINLFKWNDWCQSISVEYKPHMIGINKKARLIKKKLPVIVNEVVKATINYPLAIKVLISALRDNEPVLSSDQIINDKTNQLFDRLSQLKSDITNGALKDK